MPPLPPLLTLTEAQCRAPVKRGNALTERGLFDQQEWLFGLFARLAVYGALFALVYAAAAGR